MYGVAEEGSQSQSPIHTPSHHCRKGTKEDVEKEVKICPNLKDEFAKMVNLHLKKYLFFCCALWCYATRIWFLCHRSTAEKIDSPCAAFYTLSYRVIFCRNSAILLSSTKQRLIFSSKQWQTERQPKTTGHDSLIGKRLLNMRRKEYQLWQPTKKWSCSQYKILYILQFFKRNSRPLPYTVIYLLCAVLFQTSHNKLTLSFSLSDLIPEHPAWSSLYEDVQSCWKV